MPSIRSRVDTGSDEFLQRRAEMLGLLERVRHIEKRASAASAKARERFEARGQLLPRERLSRLLDLGAPWLELSSLAGWCVDQADPATAIPGGGVICGIGFVAGVRCVITVSDSGISAGAIQPMGRQKILRAQEIAMENRLPYVQLIESAGANLLEYQVDGFIEGGRIFRNLARLSAAGLPVFGVVHGSSTAGGAYMPGLSDYVVMVRDRAKAFLAGPPLLKAATGEIATDEALGGALMHTRVSGLGEYLADDDADAIRITRDLMAALNWDRAGDRSATPCGEPVYCADELAGVMPINYRQAIDMHEVIARIVDDSRFLDFGADYGAATVCGHARLAGHAIGIITNNGPLDPDGATKATHFIQACCQSGTPLLFMQNTTGYIVGTASERAGMIKHGSKMIQAVANATVPSVTLHCGASFGAGNYGMNGRAFSARFVFSWPNAKTAVMGGEQAALTMRIVSEAKATRLGQPIDEARLGALEKRIIENFDRQSGAVYTSARMLDDGVIDPRDTRRVLALAFDICAEASRRTTRPIQFGVARP